MKVLYTTPIMEHPPVGGPRLRVENSIKALARVCELDILVRAPRYTIGGEVAEAFYRQFCREFRFAPSVAGLSANRYVKKIQKTWRRLCHLDDDVRGILRMIDQHGISIVWCGFGNLSWPLMQALKQARPALQVVCDTDSVWSWFVLRELPFEQNPERREKIAAAGAAKAQEERAWVNLCDITTAVSETEAAYYRELAAEPMRVQIFANGIDLATYAAPPPPPANLHRPSLYLAGTFSHPGCPMERAARWFLEEVFARVKARVPHIHLYIVGRGSLEHLGEVDDPAVTVTGEVASVLPYLCHADVALVPLHFESGTRFKIMEAGACGIPIVSTTLGAEGIPVTHGQDILLADAPEAFAQAIVRLLEDKDLARKLARNCRALVQARYSIEQLAREAGHILERLDQ